MAKSVARLSSNCLELACGLPTPFNRHALPGAKISSGAIRLQRPQFDNGIGFACIEARQCRIGYRYCTLRFSERRINFSSVKMLASIFCEISLLQYSLRSAGFSRVSNCHLTRNGLAEYPDAPTTQTMSPRQSIRMRLTFCSLSHESTSKETLPLPSKRIIRSGKPGSPRKNKYVSRGCG
jgi:hypothetical protein